MSLSDPLVSVIIPTHNRPEMLAQALASVRAQTFTDYEIIVASNGEKQPLLTKGIARIFECRLITLPVGNRSLARNAAINQARGRWIAFLDDDDLWHPRKLERQVEFSDCTDKGCIFTDMILRLKNGVEVVHRVGAYKCFSIDVMFIIWICCV
jgi:glycosyltransferase involved in cell wall biosynthesis